MVTAFLVKTYVKVRTVVTSEETKEGYKVINGIDMWDSIIVFSATELKDRTEVVVKK